MTSPRSIALIFQRAAALVVVVCSLCVILPALCSDGMTYSLVSTHTCAKSVIVIDLVDCVICCDSGNPQYSPDNDGLCVAAYDSITGVLTSMYAYLIPFIPILVSSVLYNNHDIAKSALLRTRFYIFLILYRTVSFDEFQCPRTNTL